MTSIHHVVTGQGNPPVVFVHGFGSAHSDWNAQVAHLSPRHRTVAVDLRGHGQSPGPAEDCSIERYGADVAAVMRALDLPPAVLVGHSMGCRVAVEAALQAPERTAGLILVDGSQFSPVMGPVLAERFATEAGYTAMLNVMFKDMCTAKTAPSVVAAIVERAQALPRAVGTKMLTDLLRYDVGRLAASLRSLTVPVLVLQSTYSNEKRERMTMTKGQTSPYLDMLRACIPSVLVEIVAGTGHFPQVDEPAETNAAIERFLVGLA